MTPSLSIILPSHNDNAELAETIRSIYATSPADVEIVVIDDASAKPIPPTELVKNIRTQHRIGVGPARHLGAIHATGEYLLLVDSHMRFTPGWYEAAMARIVGRPNTVHCGVCLGLGMKNDGVMNMDVNHPNAVYYGATWNLFGPDRKRPREMQVFESIWAQEQAGDDYELSGIMGAAYCVPRDWYLKLNCGVHLHSYGCDEQELALKSYLAGGSCRMLKGVRLGHKFKSDRQVNRSIVPVMRADQYNTTSHVIRNKLFLILTLLPDDKAAILLLKLRRDRNYAGAMRLIESEWRLIECERAANRRRQVVSFESFLEKFALPFPA